MKKLKAILLLVTVVSVLSFAAQSQADNILLTRFDFASGWTADVYAAMETNLEAVGHTVTIVDAKTGGNLATALGSASYNQVFLYDLTSTSYLNAADITALGSFWSTNRGLVVDTRSYGYHFQGNNLSEIALLQNVAANLSLSGGGVWVGTDHDPSWTNNANPFLSAIGINPVSGSFGNPVNFANPTSVLLSGVTPTDLWGGGQTVGQAPIGIQPNGVEMFIHFGHILPDQSILPYISASFPLEGPGPKPVPEPATLLLIASGLIGLAGFGRKFRK